MAVGSYYRSSPEGGLQSPYSKKPPAKQMTFAERRAHEAEVARMTENFLAGGGEIQVGQAPAEPTSSKRVGTPRRGFY